MVIRDTSHVASRPPNLIDIGRVRRDHRLGRCVVYSHAEALQVPAKVEYTLSEMGIALGPSMEALIDWALMRREALGQITDNA